MQSEPQRMDCLENMDNDGAYSTARANESAFAPHDLLWAEDANVFGDDGQLPSWASADWLNCAPAVVRREKVLDPGHIPVGLRGKTRSQRFKTYLDRAAVARCVKPEMLAHCVARAPELHARKFAAVDALLTLTPLLDATGLTWGPTGGVGFALASRLPVLRADSDLDLVVRAFNPLDAEVTKTLQAASLSVACRLDIQIDTGHGAFSLAEWVVGRRRVMLKTDIGPFLTDDPWNQGHWLERKNENQP